MKKLQTKQLIVLIILLLLCFTLRESGGLFAWHNGNVSIQSPDAYYQMRRVLLALYSPPLGSIDLFRGLDPNNRCIWPIYYDSFFAIIIYIFTLGKANVHQAELIAAIIPPFIGTISGLFLFLICRSIGVWQSLLILTLFSVLPKNISVTIFGEIDHHGFEVMCYLGATYYLIKLLQSENRRNTILFSIWITLLFLVWSGSTLYAGLLGFNSFIVTLKKRDGFISISKSFFISGIILIPLYLFSIDTNNFSINYNFPSLFQPLFLLSLSSFFYCLNYYYKYKKFEPVSISILFILCSFLSSAFINGLSFLFAKNGGYDFTPFVGELQPIFNLGISNLIYSLTPFLFITPFGALIMLYQGWYKNNYVYLIISLNFFVSLVLTINAQRFLYLISIFIAPIIIWSIQQIIIVINNNVLKKTIPIFSFCLIIPILPFSLNLIKSNFSLPDSFYETMEWIKENTPKSGDYLNPRQMPSYSVLSHWDQGHYITYLAQRPSVSDNFGYNATKDVSFAISKNEVEAKKIIDSTKARYIILDSKYLYNSSLFEIIGIKSDEWQYYNNVNVKDLNYLLGYPTELFINSVFMKLYFQDSSDIEILKQKGLQHFRLVYESKEKIPVHIFSNNIKGQPPFFILYNNSYPQGFKPVLSYPSRYKLFEYVSGAEVRGITKPNSNIFAYAKIKTNTGRLFIYNQKTKSSKNGEFSLILSYGKDNENTKITRAISNYTINIDNKLYSISIGEDDIINNKIIVLK